MNLTELKYWLVLSKLPGIGPGTIIKALEHYGSAATAVKKSGKKFLKELYGRKHLPYDIDLSRLETEAEKDMEKTIRSGASIITLRDDIYPKNLAEIHSAPPILYVKGRLSADDAFSVAIVGSRSASQYGMRVCKRISRDLAREGVTIISGLARGIDTEAHKGALDVKGRTIAVLGSGIDVTYPPENEELLEQIAENGAVITEFPPGTRPFPENFPRRNRIISGLALGVLVVEASMRSGALITAKHALDQGRDVYALPGMIESERSSGTHFLIKQGAKLVERAGDILEEIMPCRIPPKDILANTEGSPPLQLPPEEARILKLLEPSPLHIDAIARQAGMEPSVVAAILLQLELKNLAVQMPGKLFARK